MSTVSMAIECTSCDRGFWASLEAGDVVALIVAVGSLLISAAALWATALKRAHIGIHYTPLEREWHISGFTGLTTTEGAQLYLALYAHNAGANAGILEQVEASSSSLFDGLLHQPVIFGPPETNRHAATFPRGIEAGEIEELHLTGHLALTLTKTQRLIDAERLDIEQEETFARQLFKATVLPITVRWRYARPAGFLRPKTPSSAARSLEINLPVAPLREEFVSYWQTQREHPHFSERAKRLVALATSGSASDESSPLDDGG